MFHFPSIANYLPRAASPSNSDLFIIQEKLDGSNFQIILTRGAPAQYASRNHLVTAEFAGGSFWRYSQLEPVQVVTRAFQDYLNERPDLGVLNVFGEIYGSSVINRIKYEKPVDFKFYDLYVDQRLVSGKEFENICADLKLEEYVVKSLGVMPMADCLGFDYEARENTEGVVVKAYSTSCRVSNLRVKLVRREFRELSLQQNPRERPQRHATNIFQLCADENRLRANFGKQDWHSPQEFAEFVLADIEESESNLFDASKKSFYLAKIIQTIGRLNLLNKL